MGGIVVGPPRPSEVEWLAMEDAKIAVKARKIEN